MARIRSIKPEFWTSPQIVACSLPARLAFIGLLNFCDDNGIHPASVSRLRMQIFPEDAISNDAVRTLVAELIRSGLVATYPVGDEVFWLVTGWSRHQKIDKPTYRHPLPDGRVANLTDEVRRALIENSANVLAESLSRGISAREFGESAGRGSSGRESNGVEWRKPPSQEEYGQPTEYTGGGAPKIPRRRFLAVGGDHA
jgi:hypothetical protein